MLLLAGLGALALAVGAVVIYVDGKSMGLRARSSPREQMCSVDLATGETKPIQADFK